MPQAKLQDVQSKVFLPFYDVEDASTGEGINQGSYGELRPAHGTRLINAWAELRKNPHTGASETYVQKRSGVNSSYLDTDLNTNWDAAFDNYNGGAQPTYVNFRTLKAFMPIMGVDDWMVTAVHHGESTATEGNGTIKMIFFKPSDGTVVVKEITSYDYRGSVQNLGFVASGSYYLNEFAGAYAPGSGTATTPTVYVTLVFVHPDRTKSAAFYCAYSGGAWGTPTQITSTMFATHYGGGPGWTNSKCLAGNFAMLNGRAYVMTQDGFIWGSAIGDITTATGWVDRTGAPMFENAISYPDKGVGLMRYKHHILAFGHSTTEFFSDVGADQGLPLQSTNEAFIRFGALNANSVINLDDTVYWIGMSTDNGVNGIWKLEGYTPVQISDPDFQFQVISAANYNITDDIYNHLALIPFEMSGRQHIMFASGMNNISTYLMGDIEYAVQNTQDDDSDFYFQDFGANFSTYETQTGLKPPSYPFKTNASEYIINLSDKTVWYMNHVALFTGQNLSYAPPRRAVVQTTLDSVNATPRPVTQGSIQYFIPPNATSIYRVAENNLSNRVSLVSEFSSGRFMDNDDDGAAPATRYEFFSVWIETPILDFQTNARKICSKVSILGTRPYPINPFSMLGRSSTYVNPMTSTSQDLTLLEDYYKWLLSSFEIATPGVAINLANHNLPAYSSRVFTDPVWAPGLIYPGEAWTTLFVVGWQDNELQGGSSRSQAGMSTHSATLSSISAYDSSISEPSSQADNGGNDDMLRRVYGGARAKKVNPWTMDTCTFNALGSFRRRQFLFGIHCLGNWRGRGFELHLTQCPA